MRVSIGLNTLDDKDLICSSNGDFPLFSQPNWTSKL
jgi:hypothetical protein